MSQTRLDVCQSSAHATGGQAKGTGHTVGGVGDAPRDTAAVGVGGVGAVGGGFPVHVSCMALEGNTIATVAGE